VVSDFVISGKFSCPKIKKKGKIKQFRGKIHLHCYT